MTLLKTIFCANEQIETKHELSASQSGEVVATCASCGRFLKYPAGITKDEFVSQVSAQKEANVGQVTQESINAQLAELADEDVQDPGNLPTE